MKLFNSTSKQEKNISWEYSGKPNFAVGTGATMTEQILGWGSCFVVPIILIIAIASGKIQVEWSIQLLLIALFLAFEVGGGVVCNSLNSAKRFYHSPIKNEEGWKGKLLKNPLVFAFFHIHSILVWFLFKPEEFLIGILWF